MMKSLSFLCVLVLFLLPSSSTAFRTLSHDVLSSKVIRQRDDSLSTANGRAQKAKETWRAIAHATTEKRDELLSLHDPSITQVFDTALFHDFTKIRGTLFINGLSSCRIGPGLIHPMESHGYVKSLALDGQGSLHLKAAVVQTKLAQTEQLLNCPVARGVMSSLAGSEYPQCLNNALAPSERDTANLVAMLWPPPLADSKDLLDKHQSVMEPMLIVTGDNGSPYCLDPKTLKSKGPLEVCVPTLAPALKGKKMLAHMRQHQDRLILCSTKFDMQGGSSSNHKENTVIEFLELDTNFAVVSRRQFPTRFMVAHDWMVTDHYYVIPKNPARIRWGDMSKFIMGNKLGVDVFEMDHDAVGELLLIPRLGSTSNGSQDIHHDDSDVKEIKADTFFNIFHMGPCYEEGNKMTVYANIFDRFRFGGEMGMEEFDPIEWSSNAAVPAPRFDKFVLDLTTNTMIQRERLAAWDEERAEDIPIDMPMFSEDFGAPNRYTYFSGASRPEGWFPFRSIVKMDLHTRRTYNWDAGDDCVVSEATFIRRPSATAEDDGFLISIVHNAATVKCELVVWDAAHFQKGPIGIVDLGKLMPWCVHGSFTPDYFV